MTIATPSPEVREASARRSGLARVRANADLWHGVVVLDVAAPAGTNVRMFDDGRSGAVVWAARTCRTAACLPPCR